MSHRKRATDESPHTIDALLSGSVADDLPPSLSRTLYTRPIESYDPFSSLPHPHRSPSKTIVHDSSVGDAHTRFQNTVPDRSSMAYASPYSTSHTIGRSDSIGHRPYEYAQSTKATVYEVPTRRISQGYFDTHPGSPTSSIYTCPKTDDRAQNSETGNTPGHYQTRRRPLVQDEFDGPSQILPLPVAQEDQARAQTLPGLPIHLDMLEQDQVMRRYNNVLSSCAFHFVSKYQFPIPIEREKPPVRSAHDRDWTEWAYLLKKLATKRRIPARVLHDNQIKNLVTILENSIAVRNSKPRDQPSAEKMLKDDQYMLQLISAGVQVAQVLMDSLAMQQLIDLYIDIEGVILDRRQQSQSITNKR